VRVTEPKITLAAATIEADRPSSFVQLSIQFGQSLLQHLAMLWVLNRRKLMGNPLTRQL
jgi:hypothetical protein